MSGSLAARCNFLSMDRSDLQYACKEICRRDWMLLAKLARYLVKHRRIATDFQFQSEAPHCQRILRFRLYRMQGYRKSTTGDCMMIGVHTLKSCRVRKPSLPRVLERSKSMQSFSVFVTCLDFRSLFRFVTSESLRISSVLPTHRFPLRDHAQGGQEDQALRNENLVGAGSS